MSIRVLSQPTVFGRTKLLAMGGESKFAHFANMTGSELLGFVGSKLSRDSQRASLGIASFDLTKEVDLLKEKFFTLGAGIASGSILLPMMAGPFFKDYESILIPLFTISPLLGVGAGIGFGLSHEFVSRNGEAGPYVNNLKAAQRNSVLYSLIAAPASLMIGIPGIHEGLQHLGDRRADSQPLIALCVLAGMIGVVGIGSSISALISSRMMNSIVNSQEKPAI